MESEQNFGWIITISDVATYPRRPYEHSKTIDEFSWLASSLNFKNEGQSISALKVWIVVGMD